MKLPFRTNITIALGLGLLLMALSTVTSYLTINALLEDEQSEEKIQVKVVLLERLVSQFKTTESLQRRYLLTNIDKDLAAYRQAGTGLQQVLLGASGLPMAGESLEDLRTLRGLIARRLDLMEQTVTARRQGGLEAATALVGSDLNRQLHDDIEELAGRIKSAGADPGAFRAKRPADSADGPDADPAERPALARAARLDHPRRDPRTGQQPPHPGRAGRQRSPEPRHHRWGIRCHR